MRFINPECVEGKHWNCKGDALNVFTDDIVECGCECHERELRV